MPIKRYVTAALLVIMMVVAPAVTEVQASQIFGMRGGVTQYSGQRSFVSAQNPNEYAGPIWSANPNFITEYYYPEFIEAGNMKVWVSSANQWQLHPYFSYMDSSGHGNSSHNQYTFLTAGAYYDYTVYPGGGTNKFVARWCNASTCDLLLPAPGYVDLGASSFAYAGSGGEGDGATAPIGYIHTTQNRFLDYGDSTWKPYCYTIVRNDVSPIGTISTCRPGIDPPAWKVNYK